jgi:hypothetical protein
VLCPLCARKFPAVMIEGHAAGCLSLEDTDAIDLEQEPTKTKHICPYCNKYEFHL